MVVIKKIANVLQEIKIRFTNNVPMICDTVTTLRLVQSQKMNIARFGDSEFDLIFGCPPPYQDYNSSLVRRLKAILSGNESSNQCRIGIPSELSVFSGFKLKSRFWWFMYGVKKRELINPLLGDYEYVDAQCTRFYVNRAKRGNATEILKLWKDIWNDKKVLIVEGVYTRFGVGNDLLDNSNLVGRVLCPSKNAFDYYDEILEFIKNESKHYDLVLIIPVPSYLL